MDDMAFNFKQMLKRSQDDLITSVTEITGSFATLFPKAFDAVTTGIAKYAPKAAKIIQDQLDGLKLNLFPPAAAAKRPTVDHSLDHAMPTGDRPVGMTATGGISTREQIRQISEGHRPEAIIPLDARGQAYMTGMYHAIARSVVAQMKTSALPAIPTGAPVVTQQDYSTNWNIGQVTVSADDPGRLAAELEKKKRLVKLARPPRATAGV
jgi:hypothetical protein